MLAKFEVTNFKNFANKFTFDFTKTKQYEFNSECVNNGIAYKSLVYGPNAVGKSNLGFAIFDLIYHVSKHQGSPNNKPNYRHYSNASNTSNLVEFIFEFQFGENKVKYLYGKTDQETLVYEKLLINSDEYISIDKRESTIGEVKLEGTEHLNTDLDDSNISFVSYIRNNSILSDNHVNKCFAEFLNFVDGMLFFRSLGQNSYIGIKEGSSQIAADIIKKGHLRDFESFLNSAGISCKLKEIDIGDELTIAFIIGSKAIPFYEIASMGTKTLSLFYYWFQRLEEEDKVSFVFVDEFDAFYHHDLSKLIVEKLKKINAQVVMTTHNTSIMTNDLLRPDCYFLMWEDGIKSLSESTLKDLRSSHNIEKMYKAGAFGG